MNEDRKEVEEIEQGGGAAEYKTLHTNNQAAMLATGMAAASQAGAVIEDIVTEHKIVTTRTVHIRHKRRPWWLLAFLPFLVLLLLIVFLWPQQAIAITVTQHADHAQASLIYLYQPIQIKGARTGSLPADIPPVWIDNPQPPTRAQGWLLVAACGCRAIGRSQTIPAGTHLTGADGVVVVTDWSVTVGGACPNVAFVHAHALWAGARGNIAAGDINTLYSSLSVSNRQMGGFSGGANGSDFRGFVPQWNLVPGRVGALTQQLRSQLSHPLPLAGHPRCDFSFSSQTMLMGNVHISITVKGTVHCALPGLSETFVNSVGGQPLAAPQSPADVLAQYLKQSNAQPQCQALNPPHKGGSLTVPVNGQLCAAIIPLLGDPQQPLKMFSLEVNQTWTWAYQFRNFQQLKQTLAGMTVDQAQAYLFRDANDKNALQLVAISETNSWPWGRSLPTKPNSFTFAVL